MTPEISIYIKNNVVINKQDLKIFSFGQIMDIL